MDEQEEQVRRAIGTLLQSDPLIKLLQEVRLGRMKATDPGLRAVTESWIGVYGQGLKSQPLPDASLPRLDPSTRPQGPVDKGGVSWGQPAHKKLSGVV